MYFQHYKKHTFLSFGFVLRNYVQDGVSEMDMAILTSKYGGVKALQLAWGNVEEILNVYVDFQQYLYKEKVA